MTEPAITIPPLPAHRRPTEASLLLTAVVAAALLAAAIVNVVAATGFPGNAPVEQVYSFGLTVDLAFAGIFLLVRVIRHRARPRAAVRPEHAGVLSIVAVILAVVSLLGWSLLGGLSWLFGSIAGDRLRYMEGTGGLFFVGAAWCLAFIFGTIGYRKGGGRANVVLTVVSLGVAFLVLVPAVTAGVVYGLGLSD